MKAYLEIIEKRNTMNEKHKSVIKKDDLNFFHNFLLNCLLIEFLIISKSVIKVFIHILDFIDVSKDIFEFLLLDLLHVYD
jgi:hypothetical protein